MKFIKMFKINEMSVPCAMITSGILSGLIIGLSVFLTTWIFFGGDNNRQKLSVANPALNRALQANTPTPDQIKAIQQAQQQKMQEQNVPVVKPEPATTTPDPVVKPATKK
jgi:hypothetical protein